MFSIMKMDVCCGNITLLLSDVMFCRFFCDRFYDRLTSVPCMGDYRNRQREIMQLVLVAKYTLAFMRTVLEVLMRLAGWRTIH